MTTVTFPSDLNGITEIGIAAGVDNFLNLAYGYTVYMRALPTAPRAPTKAEVRARNFVMEFNLFSSVANQVFAYGDETTIIGTSGVAAADILRHVDNWPAAPPTDLIVLTATVATQVVADYDAWIAVYPSTRPHCAIDLQKTVRALVLAPVTALAKTLFQGLMIFAVANGWIVRHEAAGHGLIRYAGPEVEGTVLRDVDEVNAIGFHEPQMCANLLVASKLTWWMMNHHVGQRDETIDGFVGKIATLQGLLSDQNAAQNKEVRSVIWAISKTISTRGVLHALGINSINYADNSNTGREEGNDYAFAGTLAITGSADVLLRVASYPAGTAAFSVYLEILNRIRNSLYGVCVPPSPNVAWNKDEEEWGGNVGNMIAAIKLAAARYHMGSVFLTGHPRTSSDLWNEEDKHNFASFIHAVAKGSSLAKSPAVIPMSEIMGNITYNAITALREKMVDIAGGYMGILLIGKMTGDSINGGMAAQLGKVTPKMIDEAKEQERLILLGEVPADETAKSGEKPREKELRIERNEMYAKRRAARALAGIVD